MKKSFLAIFLIIAGVFLLYKTYQPDKIYSGVDSAGIKWEFYSQEKILKFSKTKKSNGRMSDYGEESEENNPESLAPWWEYGRDCETVVFEKGIEYVGQQTCYEFRKLSEVKLSEDIKEIGYAAFERCECLQSVQCPKKLEIIDADAFSGSGLKEIALNESLESIGIHAFMHTKVEQVKIPDTVKILSEGAFVECGSLREIKLPAELGYIADNLFEACISLKTVEIPQSVVQIGRYSFGATEPGNALPIKYLCIPKNVRTIHAYSFRENTSIERIRIESMRLVDVSEEAFTDINPKVAIEVPKEKYDDYKELLYTHGLPKTAKVVAY